jgi:hypothetical protein
MKCKQKLRFNGAMNYEHDDGAAAAAAVCEIDTREFYTTTGSCHVTSRHKRLNCDDKQPFTVYAINMRTFRVYTQMIKFSLAVAPRC